jgi:hypothetical protein
MKARRRRLNWIKVSLFFVAGAGLTSSVAWGVCGDITGGTIPVGEARVSLFSNQTTRYANAYHNGSGELALPSNVPIGFLQSGGSFNVLSAASAEDRDSGNCSDNLQLGLEIKLMSAGSCTGAQQDFRDSIFNVNTCTIGGSSSNSWHFRFDFFLGTTSGMPFASSYHVETWAQSGNQTAIDNACFSVDTSAGGCVY